MENEDNSTRPKQLTAVYAPFKSFITSLDYLKEGLPDQIDTSVWPTFSGGLKGQIYSAYRFLGLVDEDGFVRPVLAKLVAETTRKETLADVIRSAYGRVFEVDLSRATPNQLAELLKTYNIDSASTLDKAQTFFLHAARLTGIKLSPSISRKTRSSARKRKSGQINGNGAATEPPPPPKAEDTPPPKSKGSSKTIKLKGGGAATLTLDVDVFDMTDQDQTFVFSLIRQMREYESTNSGKTETPETAGTVSGESKGDS